MAGMIHVIGVVFYAIFASGEKQPWAEPDSDGTTGDKKQFPDNLVSNCHTDGPQPAAGVGATSGYSDCKFSHYGATVELDSIFATKQELVQEPSEVDLHAPPRRASQAEPAPMGS